MQTAESLKMQSVMLGGAADPSAFMTEVGPFPYEAFRAQEGGSPQRRLSRDLLPQLSLPQVSTRRGPLFEQLHQTRHHLETLLPYIVLSEPLRAVMLLKPSHHYLALLCCVSISHL